MDLSSLKPSWLSALVSMVNILLKGQELFVPLLIVLFQIKVEICKILGIKSKTQNVYPESRVKDTSLLCVWCEYSVSQFKH